MFHDLKLMEREGSGTDLLFERLLASRRKVPIITEGSDSVHVTVPRRVVQPGVIRLLVEADQRYQLTQRERITFALVAQTEEVSAAELADELELPDTAALLPVAWAAPHVGLPRAVGSHERHPLLRAACSSP
jgi:ATP-dependent DNA helicase RecG